MTKDYSSKDVRVLDDITTVRVNTSMYIGTTETPTHLIEESFDNAVDEALGGSATIIAVNMDTKNNVYSVLDNGRGIPISDDVPIKISTKLHSGAKFQDKKSAYEICSGIHGIGLVAVNALSEWFNIEIYRNGKHAIFNFQNTKLKSKKVESYNDNKPFSTKIEFKPDKEIFESLIPDINRIRKRLEIASAELSSEKTFVLNVDGEKEIFKLNIQDLFKRECDKDQLTNIIKLESSKTPEYFNILMSYSLKGSTAPKYNSSINLLPVDNGGTHVNIFLDIVKEYFSNKAKKLGYKFQPTDCFSGIRLYFTLGLIEAKYSSQTKEKLANRRSYFDKFINQLKIKLNDYFTTHEDELKDHLKRFQLYRSKLDSKKLKSNGTKRASTKVTKLRDCRSRNGDLYITEGDSAGGSIVQSRDPNLHAIFPLKGKIPNISNAKNILKHNEIGELMYVIGSGVEPQFNMDALRYRNIVVAADADPDGGHIASLLIMVFAILTPEIIKQGRFFIAQTPLFAINEKKLFQPLWTKEELDKAIQDNRHITRFKGLGELSPHQMKICLLDTKTRRHEKVAYSQNIKKMLNLFASSDEKRKLLETL